MLTNAPPRNADRAGFLESDRLRTLDLPQNGRLPAIAKSIESAMQGEKTADVRRVEFLAELSAFYKSPALRHSGARGTTSAGARTLGNRTVRRL